MKEAPKTGELLLVCRNNDVFWEYDLVYWQKYDPKYPWISLTVSEQSAYPEGRLDYFTQLTEPYEIKKS